MARAHRGGRGDEHRFHLRRRLHLEEAHEVADARAALRKGKLVGNLVAVKVLEEVVVDERVLGEDREHHEEQLDVLGLGDILGAVGRLLAFRLRAAVRDKALDKQLALLDLLDGHLGLRVGSQPRAPLGRSPELHQLGEHLRVRGQPRGHPLDHGLHEHDAVEAERRGRCAGDVKSARGEQRRLCGELLAHGSALVALDDGEEHAEEARVGDALEEISHRLGGVAREVRDKRGAEGRPVAAHGGGAGHVGLEVHRHGDERVEKLVRRGRQQVEEREDGRGDLDLVARLERLGLAQRVGVGPPSQMFEQLLAERQVEKVGEEREQPREA
eukprot:2870597-Pleurochrysis_carterae.AAC.1